VYQSFLDIMKDFKTQRYLSPPLARDHCFNTWNSYWPSGSTPQG
jgi:hypothetical protein